MNKERKMLNELLRELNAKESSWDKSSLHQKCLVEILTFLKTNKFNQQEKEELDLTDFVTLKEFEYTTRLCDAGTIARLLRDDPEFLKTCGCRPKKKFYVKLEPAIEYISKNGGVKLRKRAQQLLNG